MFETVYIPNSQIEEGMIRLIIKKSIETIGVFNGYKFEMSSASPMIDGKIYGWITSKERKVPVCFFVSVYGCHPQPYWETTGKTGRLEKNFTPTENDINDLIAVS